MIKIVAATALSAIIAITSVVPVGAMPIPQPRSYTTPVETVQYRDRRGHWDRPGHWHGHRGYRHERPGYRRHSDGWWYPLAAFGLGAAIGGMLAAPPPPPPAYRVHSRHEAWCYNRYRSYRASDNTYQPNRGPRKQCISPYSR